MKHFELKAELRSDFGKKANKKIRKEDCIPAVVYGGSETRHINVTQSDVRKLIYTPEVMFADIDVNGAVYTAIVKDVQYHPVTDKILHIDFYEISAEKPLKIAIPVKLTGSSEGVKAGGKLKQNIRKITVKGNINDIPDFYNVDVTELNIGQYIRIKDLTSDIIEFADAKSTIIASVASTRGVTAETTEESK